MNQDKHLLNGFSFYKTATLSLATLSLLASIQPSFAQITPASDGTNTQVTVNGNQMEITGGQLSGDGGNLFHSFQQFGVTEGQIANFMSTPSIQNILGRVVGGQASHINGLIQVTGGAPNLFLMNPAGVIFGPSASLNVPASFTVTTANGIGLGDQWFNAVGDNQWGSLVGTPSAFRFDSLNPGTIVNSGTLSVGMGQNLTLLGGTVINTGTLSAPGGMVSVMAVPGEGVVRISQPGHLLSLEVAEDPQGVPGSGLALPELLTGEGVSQATGVMVNGAGEVVLMGSGTVIPNLPGTNVVSGRVDVVNSSPLFNDGVGGVVNVLGERVGVIGAEIDASGVNGGGVIRIGGDYKGQGVVPNAMRTVVTGDSVIAADALSEGAGGRVIVWADGATRFEGEISARGGEVFGDGGFVEVSGKEFLDYGGSVNTSAVNGNVGTLLLDPTNIVVVDTGAETSDLTQVDLFGDGDIGGDGDTRLDVTAINNASSNVVLQASNDITFEVPVNVGMAGVGITAEANNNITVKRNIITNGGDISLIADADSVDGGTLEVKNILGSNILIDTGGGNFIGRGQGSASSPYGVELSSSSRINAGGGNIEITGIGGDSNASINSSGIMLQGNLQTTGLGNIILTGTGKDQPIPGAGRSVGIHISGAIRTQDGNIEVTGMGGNVVGEVASASFSYGIHLTFAGLLQSTGNGTILLNGISGNTLNHASSAGINGRATIISTNGDISLIGQGGNVVATAAGSGGISYSGNISSVNGNINLMGIQGSGYSGGVGLVSGTLETTGLGQIYINGLGGIYIGGGLIKSDFGNITLEGLGGENWSIDLYNNRIQANGDVEITLIGNNKIRIDPRLISSVDGDINLISNGDIRIADNVEIKTTGLGSIYLESGREITTITGSSPLNSTISTNGQKISLTSSQFVINLSS